MSSRYPEGYGLKNKYIQRYWNNSFSTAVETVDKPERDGACTVHVKKRFFITQIEKTGCLLKFPGTRVALNVSVRVICTTNDFDREKGNFICPWLVFSTFWPDLTTWSRL